MTDNVRENFNRIAREYDKSRRILVPCFDDFYSVAIEQLPFNSDDPFELVDLGAGTGLFSALVREQYPKAQLVLIDIARDMLDQARERFKGDSKVTFEVGDYSTCDLPEADVIISALSIHHLEHKQKRALYQKVFEALNKGGIFVNADLVLGATPKAEAQCYEKWTKKMHELGITDKEFEGWRERLSEDRYAPLEPQLAWLRETGFSDVECFYRYYNFAVFCGTRKKR